MCSHGDDPQYQHLYSITVIVTIEIDGLDPQKREMLEARITGRVSTSTIMDMKDHVILLGE